MKQLRPVFLAAFFFSIHTALLAYINSSMLGVFGGSSFISIVYTLSSALSLILIFYAGHLIHRFGLVRLTVVSLIASTCSLIIMGSTAIGMVVIPLFCFYFSLNSVIFYCFDIFIEHYSKERNTGNTRGLYLTLNNAGWVLIPALVGVLSSTGSFSIIYLLAACVVLFSLLIIILSQQSFKDARYKPDKPGAIFAKLKASPAIRRIMSINFMLQFFFVIMVVYAPLYMIQVLGFEWRVLGILLSIMLLPFVLFQYPAGKVADRIGEKYIVITGMGIAGIATLLFAYLGQGSLVAYATVLFLTRVGASLVEVSTDSYFFKHVSDEDTAAVSLYRAMLPLAYVIAPMTAALILIKTSYTVLFFSLSIMLFLGTIYAFRLSGKRTSIDI
jgi:MFS family permease